MIVHNVLYGLQARLRAAYVLHQRLREDASAPTPERASEGAQQPTAEKMLGDWPDETRDHIGHLHTTIRTLVSLARDEERARAGRLSASADRSYANAMRALDHVVADVLLGPDESVATTN